MAEQDCHVSMWTRGNKQRYGVGLDETGTAKLMGSKFGDRSYIGFRPIDPCPDRFKPTVNGHKTEDLSKTEVLYQASETKPEPAQKQD